MPNAQESVHLVAATVGFISYALLWLGIVWGALLRGAWANTRLRHATVGATHQLLIVCGLVLALVHALAQLAVPGGPVRWINELVPFSTTTDRWGTGLGVIAIELLLAIALSTLVQRRLGYRRWRSLHTFGYLAFTLMSGHVLISGSDLESWRVRGPVIGAWAITVILALAATPWARHLPATTGRRSPARHRTGLLDIHVDSMRCTRFGFCEQEAPDLFQLRGDGELRYSRAAPVQLTETAVRAAQACPMRAIMVTRPAPAGKTPGAQPPSAARSAPPAPRSAPPAPSVPAPTTPVAPPGPPPAGHHPAPAGPSTTSWQPRSGPYPPRSASRTGPSPITGSPPRAGGPRHR